MRKVIFLSILLAAICGLFAQEGYPAGYFYFIYRGDTVCVEPVITDSTTEAEWFDFSSASMHTGLETAYETHMFFFYNPYSGNIGMVYQHNIDEVGTSDATGLLYLDGLPSGCSVALSDDAGEFNLSAYPQGDWAWWNNTDGCAWYIPRDEWQFTMRMQWGSIDPIRSYWFLSGAEGDDRIRLDTVYIDQEDSIIVGHGFLQALHYGDPDYDDSVLVGTSTTYGIPFCNSDETIDTLRVGSINHTDPTHFVIGDDYDSRLFPGECTGFEVDFIPTEPGVYYDTLNFIYNNPCDSIETIIVKRKAIEPEIIPEFMQETMCDGQNMVELCWTMRGVARTPFDNVRIEISSDGGESWDVPITAISDFEGDVGSGIAPGRHCITWDISEDLPDYESCDVSFRVFGEVPGIAHVTQSTAEDFEGGDLVNIDILTPDPDGMDDGALWILPGSDTIKVLQVYPNGHCTDCMSNAIYSYMDDGDPALNIKIYIVQMTDFNAALTSGMDTSPVTCAYIDASGTIHPEEEIPLFYFDVVMFGVADSYGGTTYDLTDAACDALRIFAARGKGLLFSHDTIGCSPGHCMPGFCSMSDVSGISCVESSTWASFSSVNRIGDADLPVLHAPFEIPETFSVLNCHWKGQVIDEGWFLYQGAGSSSGADNRLYWQAFHNTELNSFSSFYSYGHIESMPSEWEAKAMINSIYFSYHGGIGTGIYTSEPVDFPGGASLVDVTWSVDIPHCGGSVAVEIAADTCIGIEECWTGWMPVDEETPEINRFDRIRYRIGMTGGEGSECESPVLHWFAFDIMDSTVVTGTYDGCLDSYAPRVTIDCPGDTFAMYDTIHFEWEIEDMFFVNDLCSVFVEYCGMTDTFLTEETSLEWIVPERFCDSTWVNLRVAARDSFCNWGENTCSVYAMPIWYVELGLDPEIACAGDTILVPVTIDSLDYGWITSFEMDVMFDTEILVPINIVPGGFTEGWEIGDITVEPDSAFMSYSLNSTRSIAAGSGGILCYIRAYVPVTAGSGVFSSIEITRSYFNIGNPIATHNPGMFVTCVMPSEWVGLLRINDRESGKDDLMLAIGATESATDGYDPGLDLLILPSTPEYVDAWLELDDPRYPHIERLRRDYRSLSTPQRWYIPTNGEERGVIRWDPSEMPDGRITLNGIYDMKIDSIAYFGMDEMLWIDWTLPTVEIESMELVTGWNMISMPVIPVSTIASEIFDFSPIPPFGYDAPTRTYFEVEEVQPGMGYWVYSMMDTSVQFAGMPVDTFNLDIYNGWNLIGASGIPRAVSSTCTSPADIIVGPIYGYEAGGYIEADTTKPLMGYWLLSSEMGIYSNPSGSGFCKILPLNTDAPLARLEGSTMLEFGISSWAEDGLDPQDRGIPPHPPEQNNSVAALLASGIGLTRSISQSGNWEMLIPQDGEFLLYLPDEMAEIQIDGIPYTDNSRILLKAGIYKITAKPTKPEGIEIKGAWPNPFNSEVEIGLSGQVDNGSLEIYDVLGGLKTSITVNGSYVRWDGRDVYGTDLPSGIYMLRLVTEKGQDIERIMLIR